MPKKNKEDPIVKIEEDNKIIAPLKPEEINFNNRQVFLFSDIDDKLAKRIIEEVTALDSIETTPITLRIFSGGGSVPAGLALIDVFTMLKSHIITIVLGQAASMASVIAVCGSYRIISKNSLMLFHPLHGGLSNDYYKYQKDRVKAVDKINNICDKIVKKHTKLTKEQWDKIDNGELWLTAKECLKYGVVDKII